MTTVTKDRVEQIRQAAAKPGTPQFNPSLCDLLAYIDQLEGERSQRVSDAEVDSTWHQFLQGRRRVFEQPTAKDYFKAGMIAASERTPAP